MEEAGRTRTQSEKILSFKSFPRLVHPNDTSTIPITHVAKGGALQHNSVSTMDEPFASRITGMAIRAKSIAPAQIMNYLSLPRAGTPPGIGNELRTQLSWSYSRPSTQPPTLYGPGTLGTSTKKPNPEPEESRPRKASKSLLSPKISSLQWPNRKLKAETVALQDQKIETRKVITDTHDMETVLSPKNIFRAIRSSQEVDVIPIELQDKPNKKKKRGSNASKKFRKNSGSVNKKRDKSAGGSGLIDISELASDAKSKDGAKESAYIRPITSNSSTPSTPRYQQVIQNIDALKEIRPSRKNTNNKKKSNLKSSLSDSLDEFYTLHDQQADDIHRYVYALQLKLENEVNELMHEIELHKKTIRPETKAKFNSLVQKEKQIIQFQIYLRKQYEPLRIQIEGSSEASILDINGNDKYPNIDLFAPYACERNGKMVFFCSNCGISSDSDILFRLHLESPQHIMKTYEGYRNEPPELTVVEKKIDMPMSKARVTKEPTVRRVGGGN